MAWRRSSTGSPLCLRCSTVCRPSPEVPPPTTPGGPPRRRGLPPVPGAPGQIGAFGSSAKTEPDDFRPSVPSARTAVPAIRSGVTAGDVSLLFRARMRKSARSRFTLDPYSGNTFSSTKITSPSKRSPARRWISEASRTRRAWNWASGSARWYQSGNGAAASAGMRSETSSSNRRAMSTRRSVYPNSGAAVARSRPPALLTTVFRPWAWRPQRRGLRDAASTRHEIRAILFEGHEDRHRDTP